MSIYAFSAKPSYDLFCASSPLALTPFPLVKGYLLSQITDFQKAIHLVVIDAAGPREAHLNAATMHAVLAALEQKADNVTISFRLTLVQDSGAYRVEKAPLGQDELNGVESELHTGSR